MKYPVPVEGMETRKVFVKYDIFWGAKLMIDKEPAPKGKKRGQYLIERDDGQVSVAKFKGSFINSHLNIVIDGKEIALVEPLSWRQWLWAWLPLLWLAILVFVFYGFDVVGIGSEWRISSTNYRISPNGLFLFRVLGQGGLSGLMMLTINMNFYVFRLKRDLKSQYRLVTCISISFIILYCIYLAIVLWLANPQ